MPSSKHPVCRMDITINMPNLVVINDDMDDYENNDRYALHLMKCMLKEIFDEDCKKYVFQLEWSKKGNLHYQCRISLNTKKRTMAYLNRIYSHLLLKMTAEDMSLIKLEKAHITISPTQNVTKDFDYVIKSESRVPGYAPCYNVSTAELEPIDLPEYDELPEWSRFIWEEWINNRKKYDPYGRKILFCIDKEGGLGKSTFVKWLGYKNSKDVYKVDNFASDSNFSKPIITAGAKMAYIMDIPKTLIEFSKSNKFSSGWLKFALMLETLKDGYLQSSMNGYRNELIMNSPSVVVFTNYYPPNNVLSKDRIVLWDLASESTEDFAKKNLIGLEVPIYSN